MKQPARRDRLRLQRTTVRRLLDERELAQVVGGASARTGLCAEICGRSRGTTV